MKSKKEIEGVLREGRRAPSISKRDVERYYSGKFYISIFRMEVFFKINVIPVKQVSAAVNLSPALL